MYLVCEIHVPLKLASLLASSERQSADAFAAHSSEKTTTVVRAPANFARRITRPGCGIPVARPQTRRFQFANAVRHADACTGLFRGAQAALASALRRPRSAKTASRPASPAAAAKASSTWKGSPAIKLRPDSTIAVAGLIFDAVATQPLIMSRVT